MRVATTTRLLARMARPLLVLLLIGSAARASERIGRIEGTIYDDEGNPMAGAKVAIRSPTQIGGSKAMITDSQGGFRFLGLIPGVFSLTVRKPGFIGAKRTQVRVHSGRTATLDILLDRAPTPKKPKGGKGRPDEPGAPAGGAPEKPKAETYVIKAARPVVDVTKATTGETLSDEYLENMPIVGRSYQGVAGSIRGVTQQRNPKGAGAGNPSVSGGAYFNNTYTVDGMETTDPVTHTFSTNFNFDAMADVNVMTGGMGPEYSDTPGGVINMVTRSGSNSLKFDASFYYQSQGLTIQRPDERDSKFSTFDVNLNIGGPIVRDKLWFYTSFEFNRNLSTLPPDPDGTLPNHPSRLYLGMKGLVKLTWQPSAKHKFMVWAQSDPASIKNTSQLITVEPDAEGHQNQGGLLAVAAWEWLASSSLFVKNQLGLSLNYLRVDPESGNQAIPQITDVGTGVTSRNYSRVLKDDRIRLALQGDATYFRNKSFGDHEIKLGYRFSHLRNPSQETITGNQVFNRRFGQPYQLTRYFLDFDEASACDPTSDKYDPVKCKQGSLDTEVSGNKLIVFLQDRWKLPGYRRLRLIPGVAFHLGNSQNPDGETVTDFKTATAHINFAWDLMNDGKTVLRGGYNQYVDVGFLSLPRFIGRDQISQTCNWDPDTRTYSANCRVGGRTRTVGVAQPEFDAEGNVKNKFNPDALSPPRVHEWTLGAEREWLTGFSTGVDFQYRRYTNQWEDLETNVIWNQIGDNSQGFKNGKSEFIFDLETPKQAYHRYISLSAFARRFIGNWQLMASYTWSKNTGTVAEGFATVYLDRPRQAQFFNGPLPDDRRHVFKVTGFYRWRNLLTFGGSVWLGSGTPYDKLYFNTFFGDYADRRATRGQDPGDLSTPDDDRELRMPWRMVLDIKVTYKLAHLTKRLIGEKHNLELVGELFNAFNLRTPTRYEDRNLLPGAAKQWGDIIDRQSPFRVRFGLRYRY